VVDGKSFPAVSQESDAADKHREEEEGSRSAKLGDGWILIFLRFLFQLRRK
jgi:hypothetical protein